MTQQERDEIKALVLSFSTRISDLPEVESLQDDDYITVVQNDGSKKHSKKATLMALLELIKVYYPDNNGAKFQGIAHPTDSNVKLPVGTDGFWFAIDPGVYINYGGVIVGNSPKVIYYNVVTGEWSSDTLWGEIGGAIKVKLVGGENYVTTKNIPITSSATYTFGCDVVPSGSIGVGTLTEYDRDGNVLHTEQLNTNPKTITTQSGAVYARITYPVQQGNPPILENSSVTVSSTLRILVEALYNYVTDVLISRYDDELIRLGNELASLIIDKDRIAAQVHDLEGNMALLEITATQILARVSDAEGNIAQLYIRADEIGTRVENAEGDISTLVQRADSITATVQNAQGDIAQLQITARAITSTVQNMQGDISEIRQTATSITARVQDAENNIASLEITSRAITSRVSDAEGNITQLQQTSTAISARLADAEGNLNTLEITAQGLASRITDTEGNINTLTITASMLESQIQDAQGNISTLTQTAEQISMRVQSTEVGVAALSIRADEISASVESLDGDVASLSIRSDQIQSIVESHTGEISSITQRADEIELRVADTEGNISTLTQTATSLTSQIYDIYGNMSVLEQTAQSLTSRISSAEGNISTLEQTAYGISTRVEDLAGNVSILSQTVDGFEAQVKDIEGNISTLTQTAENLTSRISNTEGDVSILRQTAIELSSAISDAQGNISTLNQTVDGFELRVISMEGDMSSIHQDVSNIELRVQTTEGNVSSLSLDVDRIDARVSQVNSDLGDYETYVNGVLGDLQDQIDGAIDTWFYNGTPTLNNLPASEWTTTTEKDMHLGDVYYDNETGYAYRFTKTNNTYSWVEITDSAVVDALRRANNAQDTADHKRRVFVYSQQYPTPYAPYDPGDLWIKPIQVTVPNQQQPVNTTVLYRCLVGREKTSNTFPYNPSVDIANDWGPADGQALIVSNANIELLYNSITNTVNSYTYNADGTLSTTTQNMIKQTAEDTILTITGDELETVGIFIHNANPSDNYIVLQSDVVKIKGTGDHTPTGLAIIWDSTAQRYKIDVDSLNVAGIFSTTEWDDKRLDLYNDAKDYTDDEVDDAKDYLINTVIPGVVTGINDDYGYLKAALLDGTTIVAGGLMLSSLIKLGYNAGTTANPNWVVKSGINGIAVNDASIGYGIAAWFGGEMLDWKYLTPQERQTEDYAKSLFRMDGSGYLASGELQWGASGELIIHGQSAASPITIENAELKDGNKTLTIGDLIISIEDLLELKSWFEKEEYTIPGQSGTHYRLKLVGSTTGLEGLHVEGHILSDSDQIVISGTPMSGGGGGGASNLYDLLDIYGNEFETVYRADGTPRQNGDLLAFNSSKGDSGMWVALPSNTVGKVTSVVGQIGDVNVTQLATALTNAGYKLTDTVYTLPLAANGTRGGIQIGYTTSGKNYAVQLSSEKAYVNVPWTDTTYKLTLNGTVNGGGSTNLGSFYAPTTSGTSGQFLVSGGNNTAPSFKAIALTDLPSDVQTSLGLANSAYQKPDGGIPANDLASTVQTNITNGATAYGYFSSGVLPVSHGGTGRDTLTSGSALIGNGTGQVSLRSITNNTSATAVTASTNLITANTLYYHKGNSNIVTVGTISSGVWQGTPIANAYIANSSITIGTTTYNLGDTKTVLEGLTKVALTSAGELIVGGAKITWVAPVGSTPGYLKIDKPLVTEGDQIVLSGTPGSGGGGTGGASNLYNLQDVYGNQQEVVKRADGSLRADGDLLSFNSALNKWVALNQSAVSPDLSNYYTKGQADNAISSAITALNLGSAATYSIGSVAQDNGGLVTGGAVWAAIDALPEPMVFKGSLGTNGTIQSLPTASGANEGFTYKVITAGTYASQSAKIGDLFICAKTGTNSWSWVWIPSGDEPSGTVTSVGVSVPTGFSVSNTPVTTSGTIAISFATGYSLPTTANQTAWSAKYDKPSDGIPKSDLTSAVQTSLGLANSALQSHQTVTLASGTNNGTLKITTAAGTVDNIAVKGLGSIAYKATSDYLAYSTELASSTNAIDLNDYTSSTDGEMKLLSWDNAGSQYAAHRPVTSSRAASLYVLPNRWGGMQLYVDYNSAVYYLRNKYNDWTSWVQLYHSGNSNKSNVAWTCSTLTANGAISAINANQVVLSLSRSDSYYTAIEFLGKVDGTADVALGRIGYNTSGAWVKDASDTAYRLIYHQGNLTKAVITGLIGDETYHPYGGGNIAFQASTLTATGTLTVANDDAPAAGEIRGGQIVLTRGASTTANNSAGAITFYGRRLSGSYRNGARIASVRGGSWDLQDLVFYTSNNQDTAAPTFEEAMRIAYNKAVSINASLSIGTTLGVTGLATLTGGASIPATSSLKIGSATITWNSNGYLHIDKPLVTAGDQIVISGTPGGGGGGGATTLNGLEDVSVSSLDSNHVLVWDTSLRSGQGAWKNVASSTVGRIYSQGTGISISNANVISLASTYAGGTAVTLNGQSKAASTASFFAPSVGGAANKVLIGKGTTTAPDWSDFTLTGTANTAYNLANFLTGNQNIILSGDVSGGGTTSINVSIGAGKVTNAMLAGSIENSKLNTIGAAKGGTGLTTWTGAYRLIYSTAATTVTTLAPNTSATRKFLRMTGTGSAGAAPAWDTVTKTDVGLSNVENTALSSWAGTSSITTLGTITTGVWNGTAIANSYLANSAITINGTSTSLGGSFNTASITAGTAGQSTASSGLSFSVPYVTISAYGIVTAYGTHTHTISAANITTAIGSTTYAPYHADGYLPLSGGTLTGPLTKSSQVILSLSRTDSYFTAIEFLGKVDGTVDTALGKIGYSTTGAWVRDASDTAYRYIWHSGNSNLSTVDWSVKDLTAAGNIYLPNLGYLYGKNSSGTDLRMMYVSSSNNLIIGIDFATAGTTYIYGNTVSFRAGGTTSIVNIESTGIKPYTTDTTTLGTSSLRWSNIYGNDMELIKSGGNASIILRGTSNANVAGGSIYFYSRSNKYNGFRIGTVGATYDRQSLVFYISGTGAGEYISDTWTQAMRIHYDGKVKIGTGTPSQALDVTGSILSTGDQVVSSDLTKKTNLIPINIKVKQIAAAPAVTFDWKTGGHSFGSVAQYWKDVLGEAVLGTEGNYALAYGQLALVNTIIEAREIDNLKERIAELEAEVKRLKNN